MALSSGPGWKLLHVLGRKSSEVFTLGSVHPPNMPDGCSTDLRATQRTSTEEIVKLIIWRKEATKIQDRH